MPLFIANESVTDSYEGAAAVSIGGDGQYAYGTLIVTDNDVSILFFHGIRGQGTPFEYERLSPGTYPLFGGPTDFILQLQFRNADAGQVAKVSCWLYEPGRAGLAPTAVINPLASSGITRITSADGSVTVTNPTGPTVDLSVPGFSGFLKWGNNTDSGHVGLSLAGHGAFAFSTGGSAWTNTTSGGSYSVATAAGAITLDARSGGLGGAITIETNNSLTADAGVGVLTLKNFWSSIVFNNGPQSITITAPSSVDILSSGSSSRTTVQDIEDKSSNAGNAGGEIYHTVNPGHTVVVRDTNGNVGFKVALGPILLDAYGPLAVHGPTGATAATRFVGGTAAGAPVSGTFLKGDFVVDQSGAFWICTVAGTPGTWAAPSAGINQLTGDVTAGPGSGSQAATLAASGVVAGTYGDSANVPQVTFDAKGRATGVTNVSITGSGGVAAADGWIDDSAETWTYASGSGGGTATFTIAGIDLTAKYSKGTRIKLTQTTVKYFVVIGSTFAGGNTTVTITAGTDFTLANAAISANFHSYMINPQGYPVSFSFGGTITGFSSTTSTYRRFSVAGNIVSIIYSIAGTSNSANFTFDLPASAIDSGGGLSRIQSGGGTLTTGLIACSGTTATMGATPGGTGGFVNSGAKLGRGIFSYEIT